VSARGNVLAQIAFLAGLAVEDLDRAALGEDDPRFPLLVCVAAHKAG
jgi:DNA-binding phage protein